MDELDNEQQEQLKEPLALRRDPEATADTAQGSSAALFGPGATSASRSAADGRLRRSARRAVGPGIPVPMATRPSVTHSTPTRRPATPPQATPPGALRPGATVLAATRPALTCPAVTAVPGSQSGAGGWWQLSRRHWSWSASVAAGDRLCDPAGLGHRGRTGRLPGRAFAHHLADRRCGRSRCRRHQHQPRRGEGMIATSNGEIITNNHVIEGARPSTS